MSQKTFSAEIEVGIQQTIWVPMKVTLKAKNRDEAYERLRLVNEPADLGVLLEEDGVTIEEATSVEEVLNEVHASPIRSCIESRDFAEVEFSDWDGIEEVEDEDGNTE